MFAVATLLTLVNSVSGTPYVTGGDSPCRHRLLGLGLLGHQCGDRPAHLRGSVPHGEHREALLARGFQYGSQPGALVVGWNGGHTAATLPDGTPVSSGEGGGVKVGGGGAYQPQFTNHMFLPMPADQVPPPPGAPVVLMGQQGPMPPAPPMAPATPDAARHRRWHRHPPMPPAPPWPATPAGPDAGSATAARTADGAAPCAGHAAGSRYARCTGPRARDAAGLITRAR